MFGDIRAIDHRDHLASIYYMLTLGIDLHRSTYRFPAHDVRSFFSFFFLNSSHFNLVIFSF